jgi:hypothetical protein
MTIHRARRDILSIVVFWWPVWFIAVTSLEMGTYYGFDKGILTAIVEVCVVVILEDLL